MHKISTLFAAAAIASSAALLPTIAQASLGGNLFQNIPETFPHIYLSGLAGTNNSIVGRGEALIPIYLQGDKIFYGDLQANVSGKDKNWKSGPYVYSAGLGYRQIYNNRLYGGYLFADRHMSSANKQFWVLSPGFEDWGKVWDFEVTGYYPLSRTLAHEGWASNFGDYSHVRFQQHTQFDHWFKYYEKMGPGLTAEVGRTLLNPRWKGYLAGYYFNIKDSHDILGAGLRLTYRQDDHLRFILEDSYDNENHNLIMGGFRISLTGSNDDQDMHNRLFAPADRYYITALTQSSSLPINTDAEDQGNGVQFNNIVFFKPEIPGSGPSLTGNGTYENPYIGFDQNYVNQVHTDFANGARMYFEKGFNGEVNVFDYGHVGEISLYGNQGMFGRTDDFKAPAQGDEREIFHGHFGLNGGNTLDSIKVFNQIGSNIAGDPPYSSGVTVNAGATGNVISNTQVGEASGPNSYVTGINLLSGSELTLNDSDVYAYFDLDELVPNLNNAAVGIDVDNATLNVNNSQIYSYFGTPTAPHNIKISFPAALGIYSHADNGGTAIANISGSTVNVYAASGSAIGLYNLANPTLGSGTAIMKVGGDTYIHVSNGSSTTSDYGCGIYNEAKLDADFLGKATIEIGQVNIAVDNSDTATFRIQTVGIKNSINVADNGYLPKATSLVIFTGAPLVLNIIDQKGYSIIDNEDASFGSRFAIGTLDSFTDITGNSLNLYNAIKGFTTFKWGDSLQGGAFKWNNVVDIFFL